MTPPEHRELIEHVGRLLNAQGLGALHAEAVAAALGADLSGTYCARYLEAVVQQLEARSSKAYLSALHLAREYISTSDGFPVDGIVVSLGGAESDMLGHSEVSLGEAIDMSRLLLTLRKIAGVVSEDRDSPR